MLLSTLCHLLLLSSALLSLRFNPCLAQSSAPDTSNFRSVENTGYRIFDGSPVPSKWPVVFAVLPSNSSPPNWPSNPNSLTYVWKFENADTESCNVAGVPRQSPCVGKVVEQIWSRAGRFPVSVQVINTERREFLTINGNVTIAGRMNTGKRTIRREFRDLPAETWERIVACFKFLKVVGIWDHMSWIHGKSFDNATAGAGRTVGHGGPAFLPWHRGYLRIFERLMQKWLQDDSIGLPYWDWTIDTLNSTAVVPPSLPLFTDRYIGPNGDRNQDNAVSSGPFCNTPNCGSSWPIPREFELGSGVKRDFGRHGRLPVRAAWEQLLRVEEFDRPPYHMNYTGFEQQLNGIPFVPSFRGILEGWAPNPWGDFHNGVHRWIGGTMENVKYSIQDPVFLLHHCNVDRTYFLWQEARNCFGQSCYRPQANNLSPSMPGVVNGPNGLRIPGQMFNDELFPWPITIQDMWVQDGVLGEYRYATPGESAPTGGFRGGTNATKERTGIGKEAQDKSAATSLSPFANIISPTFIGLMMIVVSMM
ncbi:hypothetical protein BKA69DRAFT_1036432 [Paraphysoderma sedebokerense]|nr:hypothetical protein BKA69DRAFT_1036432 [Paraphysoderma sedebokerense]